MKHQIDLVKEKLKSQGIEVDENILIQKNERGRKLFVKFKEHGIEKEMSIGDFVIKYLKF